MFNSRSQRNADTDTKIKAAELQRTLNNLRDRLDDRPKMVYTRLKPFDVDSRQYVERMRIVADVDELRWLLYLKKREAELKTYECDASAQQKAIGMMMMVDMVNEALDAALYASTSDAEEASSEA